jgi:predicted Zn-dependent peptidase
MIHYDSFRLPNGLTTYFHQDYTTPMAVVNVLYNVGSRDEHEDQTGFAHLFEHLMFGGSKHIPDYDIPVQRVGGENNAFTSPDITNYYISLPAVNLDTALWLESDRMLSLSFDPKVLEVQRNVVVEEFKQRYLNQPYGDSWLKLRPLAYQIHPYRWATIGKDIAHIEQATMDQVEDFFYRFYRPNNAVLVVAGPLELAEVQDKVAKWFGDIPSGSLVERQLPREPKQMQARFDEVGASVPLDGLFKTYHMPGRFEEGFYPADLLADLLGRGKSSRLYQKLVKEKPLFNSITANCTSSLDPGLLCIRGFVNPGVSLETANEAVETLLAELPSEHIQEEEVEKVKNQAETSLVFSEVELLSRCLNIAFAANAGNVTWVNQDKEKIQQVSVASLHKSAQEVLQPNNCSTLYYRKSSSV